MVSARTRQHIACISMSTVLVDKGYRTLFGNALTWSSATDFVYICWFVICVTVCLCNKPFGMNPKIGGSSPPQVETFSDSKTWTFSQEHPFVCRKCCFPRTVNISNVKFTSKQKIYLYRQSQCSETWDSKCLALIAQMVRAFGMNPKVGGSSLPQVETFSVSKTLKFPQEHPFVWRKWMLLPTHS